MSCVVLLLHLFPMKKMHYIHIFHRKKMQTRVLGRRSWQGKRHPRALRALEAKTNVAADVPHHIGGVLP